MKRAFQIGDRVVVVRSPDPEMIGKVTRVASGLISARWEGESDDVAPRLMRDLELKPHDGIGEVGYPPDCLEPYRNDGSEKTRWTKQLRKLCGRVEVKS